MPWPPRRCSAHELELQREVTTLQLKLLKVNSALALKTVYAQRLEFLVQQRSQRIDELNGKLEQSREQIRRLDQECEHLVQVVRFTPPLDAA
jgi:chromosome segregation ATPase